jgi:hypothetical protein
VIHQLLADLRGNGTVSTVLTLKRDGICSSATREPSNEVRIYDDINGRLVRAMSYSPSGCQVPLSRFKSMDLFETGRAELVGFLSQSSVHVPIIVYWRDERHEYQLSPLVMTPPELSVPSDPSPTIRRERERALRAYLEPVPIAVGLPRGYGFSDFSVTSGSYEDPPRAAGLYRVRTAREPWKPGTHRLFERTAWSLQQIGTAILSDSCRLRPARRSVDVTRRPSEHSLLARLVDHWPDFVESCNELSLA